LLYEHRLNVRSRQVQRFGFAPLIRTDRGGFFLLPFGVRTHEEVGAEKVPGQADSAPHKFDLKRHLLKAALLALVLFAIYYVNWTYGWITADDLDFYS